MNKQAQIPYEELKKLIDNDPLIAAIVQDRVESFDRVYNRLFRLNLITVPTPAESEPADQDP